MPVENKLLKTLYRLTGLLVTLVLLFCLLFRLNYITRDKKNAWMWDNFKALPKDSVTALFVGNSHSFCSINTDLLSSVYGYESFMLSASGQSLAMDYYAIKEALKTQSPTTIYLETSYVVQTWKMAGIEMGHMFFDGMPLDKVKVEALKDIVPKENRIYFYLPLGQYHSRFTTLTAADYASVLTAPLGRFYSDVVSPCWEIPVLSPLEKEPVPAEAIEYLDKIVALCKENNIKLVLYAVPYNALYWNDESSLEHLYHNQRIFNSLADYASANGLEYYNLFWEVNDIGIDYAHDFMDSQHFNCYGQDTFTNYMVNMDYIHVNE